MIGEQVTRILINKREKRWNPKNLGPLFLTGSSRPALGKPANRYSNSRDTYVNPITNIFPGLIAGLFLAVSQGPSDCGVWIRDRGRCP